MERKKLENDVWAALEDVKDPEIPTISLVDLGVITEVSVGENSVRVEMTPTFVGCPAMDVMRADVVQRLRKMGIADIEVEVNLKKPWNTNRITERGREALRKHGLAEPPAYEIEFELDVLQNVACPFCGSTNTRMQSPFGPTLCRSIHYCESCRQAFEGFKPI